jgi:winged helix DNA-binding protein
MERPIGAVPSAAAGRTLTGMPLTARQLNRATLGRQLLLERRKLTPVEAMRNVVALQAQEPPSPYVALWNRLDGFDATALDRAFGTHAIVKAQLLRITLHAVAAADYPTFHEAMVPTLRAARLYDRRFTAEGVSIEKVEALTPDLLAFTAEPRRNADVEAWLAERLGAPKPRVWWALRHFGPIVHAPTGGPWAFAARPTYITAPDQVRPGDETASVAAFVRRYLAGFGPATMQDIAQFGTIYRPPVQKAVAALGDELVRLEGPDGVELLDLPDGLLPPEDAPAPPRLMAMWDSGLLAYTDRSRLVPPEYRKLVMRNNGDVLATILVDGRVAGVWRPVESGIEITAFHRLAKGDWVGLETEAASLTAFLAGREPRIYTRYAHWWNDLASADVRVLGG